MEQLELLWTLQEHDLKLKETKSRLEELAKEGHIETITIELKNLEKNLYDKKKQLDENDRRLKKNDKTLKELNFQLKETEKNLYDGTVTNVKQLNYMDQESKKLKGIINQLELEILSLMEKTDNMRDDISNIEKRYNLIKTEFEKGTEEYKHLTDQLREKAREEIESIYEISSKLDKDLYDRFMTLKKNKSFAISEVEDNKCSGCNMIIPTYLIDNLKRDEELQYCENCSRILYLKK